MSRVYFEFECDGECKKCGSYSEEYGCLLRPCNRNKLEELSNGNR